MAMDPEIKRQMNILYGEIAKLDCMEIGIQTAIKNATDALRRVSAETGEVLGVPSDMDPSYMDKFMEKSTFHLQQQTKSEDSRYCIPIGYKPGPDGKHMICDTDVPTLMREWYPQISGISPEELQRLNATAQKMREQAILINSSPTPTNWDQLQRQMEQQQRSVYGATGINLDGESEADAKANRVVFDDPTSKLSYQDISRMAQNPYFGDIRVENIKDWDLLQFHKRVFPFWHGAVLGFWSSKRKPNLEYLLPSLNVISHTEISRLFTIIGQEQGISPFERTRFCSPLLKDLTGTPLISRCDQFTMFRLKAVNFKDVWFLVAEGLNLNHYVWPKIPLCDALESAYPNPGINLVRKEYNKTLQPRPKHGAFTSISEEYKFLMQATKLLNAKEFGLLIKRMDDIFGRAFLNAYTRRSNERFKKNKITWEAFHGMDGYIPRFSNTINEYTKLFDRNGLKRPSWNDVGMNGSEPIPDVGWEI